MGIKPAIGKAIIATLAAAGSEPLALPIYLPRGSRSDADLEHGVSHAHLVADGEPLRLGPKMLAVHAGAV